jgi:hypothetical protein
MRRTHLTNRRFVSLFLLSTFWLCGGGSAFAQASANLFQRVPVSFEENRGQFADDSQFLIHVQNARINLKASQLEVYRATTAAKAKVAALGGKPPLSAPPLVMSFVNANSKAVATPADESSRKSYYVFNDGERLPKVIGAKHYRRVRVANLYPGIDAVYYGASGELEYDLIVQPNADPNQVRLQFDGAVSKIDAEGNLQLAMEGETVLHRSPVVYQAAEQGAGSKTNPEAKRNVASHYVRHTDGTFGIALGKRDPSKILTIDPVISFATYLAPGGGATVNDMASDSAGRVLLVGQATSFDFPLRNNLMPNPPNVTSGYVNLGFVTRFNASGTDIEFSTFVAASSTNLVRLDDSGNIYVTAQSNAQTGTVPAGLNPFKSTGSGAYIFKLSPNGNAVLAATYLGNTDQVTGLAVAGSGTVVVSGKIGSAGSIMPTSGAWLAAPAVNLGFIAKLQPTLSAVDFVTYAPEAGPVALDANGNVYIAGGTTLATYPVTSGAFQTVKKDNLDVFVTKLSASGGLLLSTFIGSNKSSACSTGDDWATSLAVGSDGGVYVAGRTMSSDYPGANPFTGSRHLEWNGLGPSASFPGSDDSRAFLLKLAPDFASLAFSGSIITTNVYHSPSNSSTQAGCLSEWGGSPAKVALDNNQNAYLIASAVGNRFPATDNLEQYGNTMLIINSTGLRVGATKLTHIAGPYAVNGVTGAIYFNSVEDLQPITPLSSSGGYGPLLMKLASPLARVTLTSSASSATVGQLLTLTATNTAVPTGGTFVLKRDGVEIARTPGTTSSTSFTVADLLAGFYAFTATYELPAQGGSVTSRTLAQVVNQAAVCP